MTPIELNDQLRARVYRLAAWVMLALALGSLLSSRIPMALAAALFGLLLMLNGWAQTHDRPAQARWLTHLSMALLVGLTLVSLRYPGHAEHWSYLVPLVAFLVYPLRPATWVATGYSVALATGLILLYHGEARIQIFFTYLATLMITVAFVYLREIREQQLKPLRKTDNLTLALTREYLVQDLEKEIQRSEREGTDLSVLALGIDRASAEGMDNEALDLLLHRLGRVLHGALRLFDSYYRYDDDRFVIILPHTGSRAALKTSSRLRKAVREVFEQEGQPVSASIGVVTLNAGDDAASLIRNALHTLERARASGRNQSLSFDELGETDVDAEEVSHARAE
ncbi:MAG: GGDEF domain-containing protein [Gammaproteobacteria bacterium]|nr:MAG: GGDEF domain-containing protein [Gammaproteobacteria bacterium]